MVIAIADRIRGASTPAEVKRMQNVPYASAVRSIIIFATLSAKVEYIAASDASKEAVSVKKIISELGVESLKVLDIIVQIYYLCEVIEFGDIKLEKAHTDDNLADPFTKALLFSKHSEHTKNIGMLSAMPQAKEPREAKRKQKRTGKQFVVELDEDDEDDEMASRQTITRWNNNEEILLAESWIEHSQDANIGKDQHDDIYWNLILSDFNSRTTAPPRTKNMVTGKWTRMHGDCQRFNGIYKHLNRKSGESDADLVENAKTAYIDRYGKKILYPHVWNILKNYPKWDAAKPIDADNLEELRKCDAAEKAYEAKREKELAIMQCKELEFLMIDPSALPAAKRAIIERKQAEIMRKYPDA
ncbi:glutathione S-transferase T3-like protein [Tanacetum coccineum]